MTTKHRLHLLVGACALALATGSAPVPAQEYVALTNPVMVDAGATQFRIKRLVLDWTAARIEVVLGECAAGVFVTPGKTIVAVYDGAEATTLMTALNKANLSTRSLHQRVIDRLLLDGKIPAGAVSGAVP